MKFKHPYLIIAYSAIGSMVGISNPSSADIKSQKEEALQSLRTTESRMESFNGELLGSGVTTTLSTIASGLSRSRKAVGMTDPYHNVEALAIFQDTKLRDQQIENSKTLHEELIHYIRHYNPETAFDLSQMSEQELQTLGRTISLASHGNSGKKPQELIDFLKGNEVTFEKEITVYDYGQHYLKSKIQIKGHFKGDSAITFNTKYKDGKLSQEGEYSVGGLSTDFLDEKANYKTKIGLKDYSITGEFSLADKISSSYSKLAPNLSIGFGYKNRSLEVGTKSEDGIPIAVYAASNIAIAGKRNFSLYTENIDEIDNLLMFYVIDYIRGYDFLDIDSLSARYRFFYQFTNRSALTKEHLDMLPEARKPSKLEAFIIYFLSAFFVVGISLVSLRPLFSLIVVLLIHSIYNIIKNWRDRGE